jgi:hexosaminidase
MRKIFHVLFYCCLTITVYGQGSKTGVSIIPQPVTVIENEGSFTLPSAVTIRASSHPEIIETAAYLKKKITQSTGKHVTISHTAPSATIRLVMNAIADTTIGNEGYHLTVSPQHVLIKANQPAGLFYGVQSLVQLFPKEIESDTVMKDVKWKAPCVSITDYPRFKWRGLMFDVSRHFFTKEEVKKYIDEMVRYKFNVLHWHLTDDEGWRIEIKSFPRLTQVGAWNVKKEGYFGTFSAPDPNEPRNYGGFYTQEDIKEVVQYAKERFVNVLPEIDVPGHSLAAVVSYPELSCTPGVEKYSVRSGEPIMDWSRGAPPIALVDNTLCPANEKVYDFLDKVVTEVAQLFPFEYIHMGGDEAPHNFWEKSDAVKALMKKEGLKDMVQVQGYFTRRVEKIVQAKGKKFIGWDEILEGGPSKSTAVMSWRGMDSGIKAAKLGHDVVMSPTTFAYIDYMQADPVIETKIYASLRLNKAYEFDPAPDSAIEKNIIGGQANLWTEQIYNIRQAEYMTWPRAFATAESVWSPKGSKNWNDFFRRVEDHFERFDVAEVKYAPSVYDPIFSASKSSNNQLQVELTTEIDGLDIHYSFDNSFPDKFYPKYTQPLVVPKDAASLKVITYRDNKPIGRMITMPITELKSRVEKRK